MSEGDYAEVDTDPYANSRSIDKVLNNKTGQNIVIVTGMLATIAGVAYKADAFDHAKDFANTVTDTTGAIVRPIESFLPGTSEDFTTPKEIFEGKIDIRTDGDLRVHTDPNTVSKNVGWEGLKIITPDYDRENGKITEKLIEAEQNGGFIVENAMIVYGQNPNGGISKEGSQWIKLLAEKDGERMYVYVNKSQQTFGQVTAEEGGKTVDIKFDNLPGGGNVIVAKENHAQLPQPYELNHVTSLPPKVQGE